jgi:hypothetical protein
LIFGPLVAVVGFITGACLAKRSAAKAGQIL